ncbi:MAG: bifunctional folylpolyglutamate synthase/dihydrofolate synthase [Planctomycetes bacterium]|nr:bifunctional folylpolyglutamate synthase/dihydrofolate synthase [Planctomycetota bacterium]
MVKFHSPRKAFNLKKITAFLKALGNPQDKIKTIHIAGTKGKGSTAIFLSRLLQASGFKTGLFTSPHLVDLSERIQINGAPISRHAFTYMMNKLRPYLKRFKPTFFEIMTTLALCYFEEEKVDYAIMETGLGGRLDATNAINPLLSLITRIDFDHMDKLGNTISSIAREKAGIIKPKTPIFTIKQLPEADKVIRAVTCRQKSPLKIIPPFSGRLPVHGRHQEENFALALSALKYILPNKNHELKTKMPSLALPARIEVVSKSPTTILDTSHNPVSIKALVKTIKEEFLYRKLILVLGIMRDKETDKILGFILPLADAVIFTRADNPRFLAPIEFIPYIKDMKLSIPIFLEPDCKEALKTARVLASKKDLIVITGSFYLAGALYKKLHPG